MKNTLEDLNNHLFAQLEMLSDEDLSSEELEKEITRTKAITEVAGKIIDNSSTVLEAMRLVKGKDGVVEKEDLPKMITG